MSDPRAWREAADLLRRAGWTHVPRDHFANPRIVEEPAPAPAPDPTPEPEPQTETTPMPRAKKSPAADAPPPSERPAVPSDPNERLRLLEELREEVASCGKCGALCSTRTQTVFSDGTSTADLCFVGEAPGADEDRIGKPFVGKAGQLLTKIIEACNLRREDVYICNVLKCRPPENRNPTAEEVENCRPYLERQLELVQPKMMVALGKYAAAYLLRRKPEQTPITRMRGEIHDYNGIPFMITFHPAFLLRNPPAKRDTWEDMKTVMRKLGRPID